ncbi:MAG: NADH-quinone oxidoreductase subunit L, partial [Prevotellaceae bacterium]|nr:NADH-quinone oxidoreductase subunit L [Prevotellaceae bacterium]
MHYTLFILILPLLSFVVLGLMDTRWKPKVAGGIGTAVLGIAAMLSYYAAFNYFFAEHNEGSYSAEIVLNFEWLRFTDKLHIDLGILLDPISVMMLVVITTVSLLVHIYSLGYMKGEKGFERYYAFLSLFTFSMLGLVVATNIFQMYIFWELVGVSSYLLIGFYYTKPEAVAASKKAFIVTRFADLGFLIGILILSFYTGTFDFQTLASSGTGVFANASGVTFMGASVLSWAMALIFIGGAGKSAMFPLHIWLPDAMEGPTPVSALIHAATMVVAGVYLVARLFPVYAVYTPEVLNGVACVGAFTALFSAVIACVQTDIKRVVAFSTISQIGFMMVGLGVSKIGGHEGLGYMSSMFHLF